MLRRFSAVTRDENFNGKILAAIRLAAEIQKERRVPHNYPFFANPLLIAEELLHSGADADTILAAILYPSVREVKKTRSYPAVPFNSLYIEQIKRQFDDSVADIVRNILEIREINLLPLPPLMQIETQPDQKARLAAFRHMVREKTEDPRALLIRIAQKVIDARRLAERLDKDERRLVEEEIATILSLDQIYVPLAEAYNFSYLRTELETLFVRLRQPNTYDTIVDLIKSTQKDILRNAQKLQWAKTEKSMAPLSLDAIKQSILDAIPDNLKDHCKIEYRIKSVGSIYRKLLRPATPQDIIGFRIIVSSSNPDVYDGNELHTWAVEEETSLVQSIADALNQRFKAIPNRYKDRIADPTDGGKREDNGYRAIHNTYYFGAAAFEVQVTGTAMHEVNTYGAAAHRRYKGFNDAKGEVASKSVTVFGPDNAIYILPMGATMGDLLGMIAEQNAEFAFSVSSDFTIERSPLFGDVHIDGSNSFSTPLHTGDRVILEQDPSGLTDVAKRWRIAMGCSDDNLRGVLTNLHFALEQPVPTAGGYTIAANHLDA